MYLLEQLTFFFFFASECGKSLHEIENYTLNKRLNISSYQCSPLQRRSAIRTVRSKKQYEYRKKFIFHVCLLCLLHNVKFLVLFQCLCGCWIIPSVIICSTSSTFRCWHKRHVVVVCLLTRHLWLTFSLNHCLSQCSSNKVSTPYGYRGGGFHQSNISTCCSDKGSDYGGFGPADIATRPS